MQLVDRIEKRRFVGREFLLFLWLESELFDATLETREHGPFGLWLERKLVLSEGPESTRITAPMPGLGREAKEALLRGQLPESAGVRIARGDEETSLLLKAETLGFSALKLRTTLDKAEESPRDLVTEMTGGGRGKRTRAAVQQLEQHEIFYERMNMTGEVETLLEALFRDFLALRLAPAWAEVVVPLLRDWVEGREPALATYEALRRPPPRATSEVRALKPHAVGSAAVDPNGGHASDHGSSDSERLELEAAPDDEAAVAE